MKQLPGNVYNAMGATDKLDVDFITLSKLWKSYLMVICFDY